MGPWRASAETNLPVGPHEHGRVHRERRALPPGRLRRVRADTRDLLDHARLPTASSPSGSTSTRRTSARASRAHRQAVSGANAFLFGGATAAGPIAVPARTNLAPQPPFFQVGILGATIPGLKLDGEVGQQIGYMNAALVGTVDFVLLILVGWAFAHRERWAS